MFTLLRKWSHHIWLALTWSVITQALLVLPGSLFSGPGLFSIPHLDKIAHLGLFGGLVTTWSLFYYFRKQPAIGNHGFLWWAVLLVFLYGVLMEFVQRNFIPNRTFDVGDIIADLGGGLIGYILAQAVLRWDKRHKPYKKN